VIFAQGSRFGGQSMFVKDGKLHYAYNFLGMEEQTFTTDLPSPGTHIFGVEFTIEGHDEHNQPTGTTRLHVNDEVVDEGPMRIMLIQYGLCGEGLCIGYDGGDAVSSAYKPRFEFTGGKIVQVVFDVADEEYLHAEQRLAALVARD
jgi:arylsulfatase